MKHCPVYIHLSASDDSDLATRTLGDADLQFGYRTPPALGELVIARRQLVAARAKRHGALARTHGDLDALVIRTEAGLLVNESSKAVAAVQNRDQFHGSGSERQRKRSTINRATNVRLSARTAFAVIEAERNAAR